MTVVAWLWPRCRIGQGLFISCAAYLIGGWPFSGHHTRALLSTRPRRAWCTVQMMWAPITLVDNICNILESITCRVSAPPLRLCFTYLISSDARGLSICPFWSFFPSRSLYQVGHNLKGKCPWTIHRCHLHQRPRTTLIDGHIPSHFLASHVDQLS